jgi:hypothetical protein
MTSARHGLAWLGMSRRGVAGLSGRGEARLGRRVGSGPGMAPCGAAGLGGHGPARLRQGRHGVARPGWAGHVWPGLARQAE